MESMDVMERTLAQEKNRFEKFAKLMHIISTVMWILFALGAAFCLIVPTVQLLQYRNNGGETDLRSSLFFIFYLFLVLGGIGLLWNSARHVFRRLRTAETPFCYDIADKIKATGTLAATFGGIWLVYRMIAEVLLKNNIIRLVSESDGFRELGYTFIFSVIILGVVLMMTAYVFNYGCKLQQESDETL